MTLGAYYQCFKNRKATEHVLSGFCHYHPTSPVILVSDGGDDFSDLAKKYNCQYFWRPNIKTHQGKTLAYDAAHWLVWWDEFSKYMLMLDVDFVIFLEDDVDIRKPITLEHLKYDVNGLSEPALKMTKLDPRFPKLCGGDLVGAQGGSIFRMSFWRPIFTEKERIRAQFKEFEKIVSWSRLRGRWPSDILFSFLLHMNKGVMGEWPGYCRVPDPTYPKRVKEDSIEVLHLWKELYPGWRSTVRLNNPLVPYQRKF